MNLANLIKKGGLGVFATATPATVATHHPELGSTVASVATVTVANASKQAANDLVAAMPDPSPEATDDVVGWHELDAAYLEHHLNCKTCIAAGRGVQYGLRCGTGAALWRAYSDAAMQPTSVTKISGHPS